jgi:hypothetical protein
MIIEYCIFWVSSIRGELENMETTRRDPEEGWCCVPLAEDMIMDCCILGTSIPGELLKAWRCIESKSSARDKALRQRANDEA